MWVCRQHKGACPCRPPQALLNLSSVLVPAFSGYGLSFESMSLSVKQGFELDQAFLEFWISQVRRQISIIVILLKFFGCGDHSIANCFQLGNYKKFPLFMFAIS